MDEGSADSLRDVSLPWFLSLYWDCLSLPALSPSQHCSVWGTQPPRDPINGLIFPQCVAVFDNMQCLLVSGELGWEGEPRGCNFTKHCQFAL